MDIDKVGAARIAVRLVDQRPHRGIRIWIQDPLAVRNVTLKHTCTKRYKLSRLICAWYVDRITTLRR